MDQAFAILVAVVAVVAVSIALAAAIIKRSGEHNE